MRVVVDTCIFDFAFLDQDCEELRKECWEVIWYIGKNTGMYFVVNNPIENDKLSCIEQEYRNKLGGVRDFEVFWKQMYETEKIKWVEIKCDDSIKTELEKLGFIGIEDYLFVETAIASDHYLITEDSDFGVHGEENYQRAYRYLTECLKIFLYSAKSFSNQKYEI